MVPKRVWADPRLIAAVGQETAANNDKAEALLGAIAGELGVDPTYIAPAYEDPAQWIVKEGNLPDNVTPENSKLKDPEERQRIARVFSRGLTEPSGYVLPIQRWQARRPRRAGAARNENAPRRPLSRPRRQPGRLSLAARLAPLCSAGVLPLCRRGRSDRSARAAAGTRGAEGARAAGRVFRRGRADPTGPGAHRADARRHRRRGPHRADGRRARWAPVRVHAAGAEARGLSRAHRCGGSGGREARTAGPDRGLRPAGRSAPQRHPRRAGPGRHRG